ncbi:MAG: group III truncated hemoglobin [Ferrovibrio sp.]|uniref:group III truncated hemoglobin n=1 Tax=Ferrovibrio sp. TaxID=1917215 RepID=UPI00261EC8F3|nr:group III truncated hemoglobin [Ferrovibrio sp.]MCW0235486.1 group III truncated hemoglobin [Ferrovibrio sp.]
MSEATITPEPVTEKMVEALVETFYGRAHADPLLGPFFAATIPDWQEHLVTVGAFWSRALLGTDRYRGCVMGAHTHLRMAPAHFDRWMALFEQSARETLSPAGYERAMSVAGFIDERLREFGRRSAAAAGVG